MLERIDLGWNPQQNRCRSKASYLEKSFENWLNTKEIFNFIKNKTFRCGEKVYFGDFFFPEKKLLIELDGKQHLKTIEYDIERDNLILKHHGVKTIRISYDEYVSRSKIDLIYQLLK
jgi:very-short-patch-repair endonuclease